ncbi:BrnA antitoxin family protein [Methylobacterium oryzisoli]|uniref:BrnA antitoxin family protein n=1 Tax=Methylobacterium oryzisoli TaxID=3385502 RepID=UPI003891E22A
MTKRKASVPPLTDAEEAEIQAGIAQDPDNPEITAEQFARMRPAAEVLPPDLYAALTRRRGRPKAEVTKVPVTIRLDRDVVEAFKATGEGWQTRVNETLKRAAKRLKSA